MTMNTLNKTVKINIQITDENGKEISMKALMSENPSLYDNLYEQLNDDIHDRVTYLSKEGYSSGEFSGQCIVIVDDEDSDELIGGGEDEKELTFDYDGWIYLSNNEYWLEDEEE